MEAWHAVGAGVAAAFGLAIVAVLVSKNAQTGTVLTSGGTALSSIIQAAVSPVTGGGSTSFLGTGIGNALTSGGAAQLGTYG
jgi:hypothetical protein